MLWVQHALFCDAAEKRPRGHESVCRNAGWLLRTAPVFATIPIAQGKEPSSKEVSPFYLGARTGGL